MCAYELGVHVRDQIGSYLSSLAVSMCVCVALCDVFIVCETESLVEQFFTH